MNQQIEHKLRDYFSKGTTATYKKGKVITLAGQEPEGVSFLLDGVIEQYDITPEGNKVVVNIFKPPAFFPMSWAINKTPNTYFYAALTDVKIQQANPAKTVAFLQANPDVLFDLLSRVYKGTDMLLRRLVLAASSMAASRLIFELLIEAYRFGVAQTDGTVSVKIRQNTLATRSGLARETVSREMHRLEQDKLITRVERTTVINVRSLEQKLDFSV